MATSLITPETMREHRARWFVYIGNRERIPVQSSMRGRWPGGFDVVCSCGEWESRTGGATRRSVADELWSHRFSAQCTKEEAGR
jgi:hypothetical protein